jgi:hypothetical protein
MRELFDFLQIRVESSFLFLVIAYDFFFINRYSCPFILLHVCMNFLIFYKYVSKKLVYINFFIEKKHMAHDEEQVT